MNDGRSSGSGLRGGGGRLDRLEGRLRGGGRRLGQRRGSGFRRCLVLHGLSWEIRHVLHVEAVLLIMATCPCHDHFAGA
jgi:hypothetical protein